MINLSGEAATLSIEGEEFVAIYRAMNGDEPSAHQRHFCSLCGSHLWAFNPNWPELLHPVASAIDTPLPRPPASVHMMLGSKADWVQVTSAEGDACFDEYPKESLAAYHEARGYSDVDESGG
ncbi:MAG: hypothetical protein ACI9KE_005131 [Polyangiales bacterium]|jgi:hypothetical protein